MKKVFKIFLLCFFTNFLFLSPALAAGSVSFNPASGTITEAGTDINIVIDSGGEKIVGIALDIKYEGDMSLDSIVSGNINGCTVATFDMGGGEWHIVCTMLDTDYSGNSGVFATLKFKASTEGTASVSFLTADFGILPKPAMGSAGSYTTTLGSGMGSGEPTTLPQTSTISVSAVIAGFCLVTGAVWVSTTKKSKRETVVMLEKVGN